MWSIIAAFMIGGIAGFFVTAMLIVASAHDEPYGGDLDNG